MQAKIHEISADGSLPNNSLYGKALGRRAFRGVRGCPGRASCAERPTAPPACDPGALGQITDGALQAPVPLANHHDVEAFASGAPTLEAWIKRKAWDNQASGASRTYILCRGDRVVGFHALAAGSVSHDLSPRKLRQNMPDPVPVIVLTLWSSYRQIANFRRASARLSNICSLRHSSRKLPLKLSMRPFCCGFSSTRLRLLRFGGLYITARDLPGGRLRSGRNSVRLCTKLASRNLSTSKFSCIINERMSG